MLTIEKVVFISLKGQLLCHLAIAYQLFLIILQHFAECKNFRDIICGYFFLNK